MWLHARQSCVVYNWFYMWLYLWVSLVFPWLFCLDYVKWLSLIIFGHWHISMYGYVCGYAVMIVVECSRDFFPTISVVITLSVCVYICGYPDSTCG